MTKRMSTPPPTQATPASPNENAEMTKFLSFLSHDLRGGLNGAVLMLEVVKRQLAKDPNQRSVVKDLEVVRRSILDTVSTMERFLNAEKLRLRRMPVRLAPIDVAVLMTEVQRNCSYLLSEREMTLDAKIHPGLALTSDQQLLMMVLQNLVSNAIKYGKGASVQVHVHGDGLPQGVTCRFAVRDQGPGIAPEKMSRLFVPFTRGETYGQQGMGLGLYIARQAADLIGVKLWAESEVGKGSTFYLDFQAVTPA
jgi:signal transduction histidine kinase